MAEENNLQDLKKLDPKIAELYVEAEKVAKETGQPFESVIHQLIKEFEEREDKPFETKPSSPPREQETAQEFNDLTQDEQGKIVERKAKIRMSETGVGYDEAVHSVASDLHAGIEKI